MMKRSSILLTTALLVSACGPKTGAYYSYVLKDLPPVPQAEARLVVYHPGQGGHIVPLTINGTKICNLRGDAFLVRDVNSGPLTIDAAGDSVTTIQASPRAQYFVKALYDPTRIATEGFGLAGALIGAAVSDNPAFMLSQVDEKTAYAELGSTKEQLDCTGVQDYHSIPDQTPTRAANPSDANTGGTTADPAKPKT